MATYLYRAVALETVRDEFGDPHVGPGDSLGRASGYLSRSSAVNAGVRSGVKFVIVRSVPVEFEMPLVVKQAIHIDRIEEQLRERVERRHLSAVSA